MWLQNNSVQRVIQSSFKCGQHFELLSAAGWCVVGWSSFSHSALWKKLASNLATVHFTCALWVKGLWGHCIFATPGKEPVYSSALTVLMAYCEFVNSPWMKEWLNCHQHLFFRLSLIFSGGLKNGCPEGLDRSIRWYDEANDLYKSYLSGLGCSPAKLRAHIMHLHLLNLTLQKTLRMYLFASTLAQLYITWELDWLIC